MALSKKQLAERVSQLRELGGNYCRQIKELISGEFDEAQLIASEKQIDQIGSVVRSGGLKTFIWTTSDPIPMMLHDIVLTVVAESAEAAREIIRNKPKDRNDEKLPKWCLEQVMTGEPQMLVVGECSIEHNYGG